MKNFRALTLLLGVTSATSVSAAPASSASCPRVVSYVDKFDNFVTVVPAGAANPVGATAGGALFYTAWSYNAQLTQILPAPSPKNAISTSSIAQALNGQPIFTPINSTIAYFDLQSLRNACVIQTQAPTPGVQTCTLQVTGVKFGTGATVVQQLIFNPVLGVNQFASASLPTFTKLISVNFQLIQATTGQVLGVPLLDNVAYLAYFKC